MYLKRLQFLLFAWGGVGLAYTLNSLTSPQVVWLIPNTLIDDAIPWQANWIIVYASFFILIPLTFGILKRQRLKALCHSFWTIAIISGLVFWCFPTSIIYPTERPHADIFESVWWWLHQIDSPYQCWPSLHASLSTLCCLAWQNQSRLNIGKIGIGVWWLLMMYSILACKRHFFWDVSAGIVLGVLVYQMVFLSQIKSRTAT